VALRDKDGDGKFETKEQIGEGSSTGVALRNGYLYVATTTGVLRYKMTPGQLKPSGASETIVMDLPAGRAHQDKDIAFDGKGSLYLNVGAPSNACQNSDRKAVPGQDPCPLLETQGGIWKFDEKQAESEALRRDQVRNRTAADARD
jgi:glucose/arabinose dehydrogenase